MDNCVGTMEVEGRLGGGEQRRRAGTTVIVSTLEYFFKINKLRDNSSLGPGA